MKQIELTHGKFALVDDEDYEYLNQFSWCYAIGKKNHTGYALRSTRLGHNKTLTTRMHREIMKCTKCDKRLVDHIDGNGLNNQKINLRLATASQNAANRHVAFGESKYLGVSVNRSIVKGRLYIYWIATIAINKKKKTLSRFPYTPEGEKLAALNYNEFAIKHHGEFAKLNEI